MRPIFAHILYPLTLIILIPINSGILAQSFAPEYVTINAGTLVIGEIELTISRAFDIGTREVTQLEWFEVMGNNPSYFNKKKHCPKTGQHKIIGEYELCLYHPVERVSRSDVELFIDTLNRRNGLTNCRNRPQESSGCYRLPTREEWEYAARGGSTSTYSWGDNYIYATNYAWYSTNSYGKTRRVKRKWPNGFGLHDTSGNVAEWVDASIEDIYTGLSQEDYDSLGIACGGHYNNLEISLAVANIVPYNRNRRYNIVGFRLAITH